MATSSFDKSLNQAPLGLDSLVPSDEPDIEIEIENPDAVHLNMDGMEIDLNPKDSTQGEEEFDDNLAEYMSPSVLSTVAGDLDYDIDQDKASRKEWEKAYVEGLKLLGLQMEERTEPWLSLIHI